MKGDGKILLLNASFEPLTTITLKRALVLVIKEKAVVVATTNETVRSERMELTKPSVVRLVHYVKVPYRTQIPLSRKALLARDKHTCQYCHGPGATIDHVIPKARGGKHEWTNVVIACTKCNNKKSDKLLSELNWRLDKTPVAPSGNGWLIVGFGELESAWQPYLASYA